MILSIHQPIGCITTLPAWPWLQDVGQTRDQEIRFQALQGLTVQRMRQDGPWNRSESMCA